MYPHRASHSMNCIPWFALGRNSSVAIRLAPWVCSSGLTGSYLVPPAHRARNSGEVLFRSPVCQVFSDSVSSKVDLGGAEAGDPGSTGKGSTFGSRGLVTGSDICTPAYGCPSLFCRRFRKNMMDAATEPPRRRPHTLPVTPAMIDVLFEEGESFGIGVIVSILLEQIISRANLWMTWWSYGGRLVLSLLSLVLGSERWFVYHH